MDGAAERTPRHLRTLNNALIFSAAAHGVRVLPLSVSRLLGHVGTWLAFRLHRRGTAALIDNFRYVFPGRPEQELRALALRTYRSYGNDTIDFLRALRSDEATLRSRFAAESIGLEELQRCDRGAILLGGHFGNWELGAVVLRRLYGARLAVMTLPEASGVVGEMRERLRASMGIATVVVGKEMETALQVRRLLHEGCFVAMLADRHADRDRVAVTLFDRTVYFMRSPALMAYFAGVPLIPIFLVRDRDGRFRGIMESSIAVPQDGDRDAAIQQAMQGFAYALERQIRDRPHLWYQFYRYWDDQREDG